MKLLSAIALAVVSQTFVAADLASVEGDGTFNIKGPVCSGPGTVATPFGSACPQIGDTAVSDCFPYHPSYDAKSGKCVAPVPSLCKPVKGGVWGCVWDLSGVAPAPAPTKAPAIDCTDVSVEGDSTFCIKGPICSGSGKTPAGDACPKVGDASVADCHPYVPSYDAKTGKCVAPVPALCKPVKTGVWGCVWDLSGVSPAPAPVATTAPASAATTPAPASKTPAPSSALVEVKVVSDGTFLVEGPACGGPAANQTGKSCPVVGDVAVSGCNSTNPSFDKASGKCVAPVPALCQPTQNGTVWGCVWDLSSLTPALQEVKVVDDGVFKIKGPVCGGPAANKTGDQCPKIGDVAVSGCNSTNPSFDKASG
ncbi:hypothetical protein Gpo141_00014649, partial [Globisporangium polare]